MYPSSCVGPEPSWLAPLPELVAGDALGVAHGGLPGGRVCRSCSPVDRLSSPVSRLFDIREPLQRKGWKVESRERVDREWVDLHSSKRQGFPAADARRGVRLDPFEREVEQSRRPALFSSTVIRVHMEGPKVERLDLEVLRKVRPLSELVRVGFPAVDAHALVTKRNHVVRVQLLDKLGRGLGPARR